MTLERKHDPLTLDETQRVDLLRRGMAAWFKAGGLEVPTSGSAVKLRLGLAYVVLHGAAGVLAVYRVRQVNDILMLRVLTRWPASLAN